MTQAFQGYVDSGQLPGAVVLIARKDKVAYFRAFGFRDREQKSAMTTDSIFRIASMTKPIVSAGAMMLVEEGKLDIAAPVSNYLPELRICRFVSNRSILPPARRKLSCSLRCGR
jgi:Beta-lactamase class C and other penicillin binding proteins